MTCFHECIGPGNFCLIHVSLVPVLTVVGEQVTSSESHVTARTIGNTIQCLCASLSLYQNKFWGQFNKCSELCRNVQKTKPTQHSVRGLRGLGLTPHILACRSTTVSLSLFSLVHLPPTGSTHTLKVVLCLSFHFIRFAYGVEFLFG